MDFVNLPLSGIFAEVCQVEDGPVHSSTPGLHFPISKLDISDAITYVVVWSVYVEERETRAPLGKISRDKTGWPFAVPAPYPSLARPKNN